MSKLLEITNTRRLRQNVEGLLAELVARGERPFIHKALRTVAEQRRAVAAGNSQTQNSLHFPGRDGLARAADIVDQDVLWEATERFWFLIGAYAFRNGVGWGGLFGRRRLAQKNAVIDKIIACEDAGWPAATDRIYRGAAALRGWDPAHVEVPDNWPATRRAPTQAVTAGVGAGLGGTAGVAAAGVGGAVGVGAGVGGVLGLRRRRP